MNKEWDKANTKTMGINMKKEDAEAFKKLAEEQGTTVGAMLRTFIQSTPAADHDTDVGANGPRGGVGHVVSYRNTDRLKHEVAFHNPKNLNPDGILNDILDHYFDFVERVRK